jgi:drug efflux transport system ATP-binding protein
MAGGRLEEVTIADCGLRIDAMSAQETRIRETSGRPGTELSDTVNPQSVIRNPQSAIRVKDLWKRYGVVEAVRGVSLEVNEGEIFGLIGPDGAGKTTTFQILAGVMEADSGVAEVFGRPAREMRAQTGYLTQTFSLYPDLSVMENIRYIGDLRRVPPDEIVERGRRYLRMFDMDRFEARLAGRLSGGMKQKLALACALVPQPRVLLLDEPTTGVDPVSRREFWDTLAHLAAEGLTILVATPYLDEAERCRRVALMHLGEIRQLGAPAELRAGLRAKRLELRASNLGEAERALSEIAGPGAVIVDVQRFGDRLDLLALDPEEAKLVLQKGMGDAGLQIEEIRVDEPTLENTFVATLRALGQEPHETPFPCRHDHSELRGRVAIGADNLVKQFGTFAAVKGVSLQVRHGEIYGLLGANGAGKTTTIKMLCGLLEPTVGEVHLAGERSLRSGGVRQQIGYMSQKFSLYNDLSIEENLDFFAGVYGVPGEESEEKKRWVLSFSGLEGKESQITGSLPGGWKQRVAFGAAIMHEPRILFLDEPTSGVDPLARRAFWKMINRLADAGAAILVTTHYLEESEQCNRLGMMVAGELVAEGSPSDLKSQQTGHLLEFIVDQPQRAADLLKREIERWRVSLFGDRLHVITDEDARSGLQTITKKLEGNGIRVLRAREGRFSMEDVFISVVEKARQEGKVASED